MLCSSFSVHLIARVTGVEVEVEVTAAEELICSINTKAVTLTHFKTVV